VSDQGSRKRVVFVKNLLQEFKSFAIKGNAIDMAVGVIVGGAFGKIVSSLVNDILMPLIGLLLGGVDFSDLKIQIGDAAVMYGSFIMTVVDFFIIAFCVFLLVRAINRLKTPVSNMVKGEEKVEAEEPVPPPVPKEEELLTEIRDLLKSMAIAEDDTP
jgi:large conductance mechanosensitive channel